MPIERNESHPDEAGIEELLREVGPRNEPSRDVNRSVEAAVHAEWRAMVERRRGTRRKVAWGIAASVAVAVAIGIIGVRDRGSSSVGVATVARVDGHLLAGSHADSLDVRGKGASISEGEMLQTDDRSRVALALADGVSMRFDYGTAVTFVAPDRVRLQSGALYIDAPVDSSAAEALTVQTRAGAVRHVGTQYLVRAHADDFAVSVREGRVLIEHEAGRSIGGAGEIVRVTTRGEVTRSAITAQDPSWEWVAQTAPRFDIENQTLAAFLDWLARETGRRVVYASPQAEDAARTVKLRGSIEGLDLETALTAVLSTTDLHRYETQPGVIGIALIDSPR